ncbi:hypothetical protein Hanom_Chr04g00338771 [Helianthus anomalus]
MLIFFWKKHNMIILTNSVLPKIKLRCSNHIVGLGAQVSATSEVAWSRYCSFWILIIWACNSRNRSFTF